MRATVLTFFLLTTPATALAQLAPIGDAAPENVAEAQPGWLGVVLGEGLEPDRGIVIRRVVPGSAALDAGLVPDVGVTAVNGTLVESTDHLVELVSSHDAGDTITLTLTGFTSQTLDVTLGVRPESMDHLTEAMVGTQLPDASMVDVRSGTDTPLVDPDGRVQVLEYWATWCGPCRAAAPRMESLRDAWSEDELRIVAISDEEIGDINSHLASHPMPYTVVSDVDRDAIDALWVTAYPTWFVVSQTGEIVFTGTGLPDLDELDATVAQLLSQASAPQDAAQDETDAAE